MRIKLLTFILLCCCATAFAQTQQGYVKTLGRPEKKGEALGGVTVRVKGEHNPVVSKQDGTFSLLLADKKNGDAYALQQVKKNGYELNEKDIIGRQFAFSDKVPLTIVMVSTEQLQADKQRIENNAYKTAEKNYKAKYNLLEKQLSDNEISTDQYQKEIQDLQNKFEKYQSLIDGLAEHYAHTDYDELDEKDREINLCIENGDLERADSLIQTLFDPIGVLERNMEALASIEQQIDQARSIIDQANEDMAAVLKQQEKDAEYLFQLYTIALARFDNEKALQYIETRAALDTTNLQWQLQAGKFIDEYIADYQKALSYYQLALRSAFKQYGEHSEWAAILYNNIGLIYSRKSNNDKALEYYDNAMTIHKSLTEESLFDVALTYNNLGALYHDQGEYDKALKYYNKALDTKKAIHGERNQDVAISYNNLGVVYQVQGDYGKSLENLNKALAIRIAIFGENHPGVALNYDNIGNTYNIQGNYGKALEYYNKALTIYRVVYGNDHPNIALCYNNIGIAYQNQSDYGNALRYMDMALTIYRTIYGEKHPSVATCYNNIGNIYYTYNDFDTAL